MKVVVTIRETVHQLVDRYPDEDLPAIAELTPSNVVFAPGFFADTPETLGFVLAAENAVPTSA